MQILRLELCGIGPYAGRAAIDFQALGELMMQKVLLAVEEPDGLAEDTPIATHLIVRESSRPPA